MNLTSWLTAWLTRHPLKGSTGIDRAQYTAEVMAKVKALAQPAPAPAPVRSWLPWPRLALTLATVTAGMLLMMTVTHQTSRQVTQQPRPVATALLAESPSSEDQWLDETLQLLDELDEDVSGDTAGDASEEDWFEELQILDETELATSS